MPAIDMNSKVTVFVDTMNMDLPKFGDSKQLKCSPETTVYKLIEYLSNSLNFEKRVICANGQYKFENYVEMTLFKEDTMNEQTKEV